MEFKDEKGERVYIMSPYIMEDKNREESTEINVILEESDEEKEEIPETEEIKEPDEFTPIRIDKGSDLIPDFYEGIDTDNAFNHYCDRS